MKIYINEKLVQCTDDITVTVLLEQLYNFDFINGMALALNQHILPREQWSSQQVRDGDRILFFQVITGG